MSGIKVVCYQLWENLHPNLPTSPSPHLPPITITDLQESGDVDKALTNFYEAALRKTLTQTNLPETTLRRWFERELITEAGTRGTVYQGTETTAGLLNTAVKALMDQFLLRAEPRAGGIWVELIHDRFIEPIQQANKKWWNDNPIIQAAQNWEDAHRDRSKLYVGQQLEDVLTSVRARVLEEPLIARFLEESKKENQRQKDKEATRQRELEQAQALAKAERERAETQAIANKRLRLFAVGLVIVFLIAVGTAILVLFQQRQVLAANETARTAQLTATASLIEAAAAQRVAETNRLEATKAEQTAEASLDEAAKAEQTAEARRAEAERLSSEAIKIQHTAEARRAEAESVAESAQVEANVAKEEAEKQTDLATSRELAVAAFNNLQVDPELSILLAMQALSSTYTVEAENALHAAMITSRIEQTLSFTTEVLAVAFSPDGTQLATAGNDKWITLWDTGSWKENLKFPKYGRQIFDIAFHPKLTQLIIASENGTAGIWDYETGSRLASLDHGDLVNGVSYSPEGDLIATAGWDSTAKVWTSDGQHLKTFSGHDNNVISVKFNLDGTLIATASTDGTAKVWEVSTGQTLHTFEHPPGVRDIAFSSDVDNQQRLATTGCVIDRPILYQA